ncbi:MAG TPA: AI-2E family transporter [Thermomonas sp.]|jgi:predicted PurR-regulated permease PerM|nr:AI-2E family transporter [Thermomonas sp.]
MDELPLAPIPAQGSPPAHGLPAAGPRVAGAKADPSAATSADAADAPESPPLALPAPPMVGDPPPPLDPAPAMLPDAPPRVPPGVAAVRVIAVIAVLGLCYLARELIVTVLLAMFLALVGNPVLTRLRRLHIPRWIGAMILVLGGLGLTVAGGITLAGPATEWVMKAPTELRQLAPKLRSLVRQVDAANKAAASIATAAGAPGAATTPAKPAPAASLDLWKAISAAPRMLMSALAVVLLAYFFLVFGDGLQRNVISLLPDRQRKQLTAEILQTIEAEVSGYVGTITLINVVLGSLLMAALWWLGLDFADAALWGTVAALLNFAPYVGPISGILFMGLVGVVAFDAPGKMFLPAAVFLGLHVLESQFVTPIILGKRMAVSPLVLLLWLMVWGWLWGIAGLLLAVPMLVVCKIVASRVEAWEPWARVIE